VSDPCVRCGAAALAAVLLPGHTEVEAVVCLRCGAVQPVGIDARPTGQIPPTAP
jgi:ribosomal protein L40E